MRQSGKINWGAEGGLLKILDHHTLLKQDGKMYILTFAPHIDSSLSYRELPLTSFNPDNLLVVNSTGLKTHTQCHWVCYKRHKANRCGLCGEADKSPIAANLNPGL